MASLTHGTEEATSSFRGRKRGWQRAHGGPRLSCLLKKFYSEREQRNWLVAKLGFKVKTDFFFFLLRWEIFLTGKVYLFFNKLCWWEDQWKKETWRWRREAPVLQSGANPGLAVGLCRIRWFHREGKQSIRRRYEKTLGTSKTMWEDTHSFIHSSKKY